MIEFHLVDFSEYVIPEEGFATFNAFFTRQIRKGLRPVDLSENVAVAPSDGFAWLEDADVRPGSNFQLKADACVKSNRCVGCFATPSSRYHEDGVEDDAMIQHRTRRKILISTQATTWSRFSGSVSDAKKFVVAMFRKV